jgi:hypothetical protein
MDRDWIDVLREKLLNHEEPVPDGLWDRIEATLQARERARRRTRVLVWSLAAAAAVALGIFAGVSLIDRNPDLDNLVIADSQDHRTDQTNNPSSSADFKEGSVTPADPVMIVRTKPVELVSEVVPEAVEEVLPVGKTDAADEDQVADEVPVFDDVPEVNDVEVVKEVTVADEKPSVDQFKTDHDGEDWSGYSSATNDGQLLRKLVAGLSMTSSARGSQDVSTVESSMFFMGLTPVASSSDEGTSFLPSSYGTKAQTSRIDAMKYATHTRADSEPVTKEENHRRPIRASLSLSYPLNDKLWLESGLTYSLLHSTFTTSSGATVTEDNQSIGYLGIPLNLRTNLFERNLLSIYAIGGGMVEKSIHGSVLTQTYVSGTPRAGDTARELNIKPLQWSVNASAGIQANIFDSFGIYAEPGLSYHFASNANVRSIYTEHPLDFIMTFGARFAFK